MQRKVGLEIAMSVGLGSLSWGFVSGKSQSG
jgi:hypothetical protein